MYQKSKSVLAKLKPKLITHKFQDFSLIFETNFYSISRVKISKSLQLNLELKLSFDELA
jgi:hypothetical protein